MFDHGKAGFAPGFAFQHAIHTAAHGLACGFIVKIVFLFRLGTLKQKCEHCYLHGDEVAGYFADARGFPWQLNEAVFFVVNPVLMRDNVDDRLTALI